MLTRSYSFYIFILNGTPTTEIYTLSLHDALPILRKPEAIEIVKRLVVGADVVWENFRGGDDEDRKSTRLNSSHRTISYAVFCLKKKNINHDVLNHIHPGSHDVVHHELSDDKQERI